MNRPIIAVIVAIVLVNASVLLIGFNYLQGEINHLNSQSQPVTPAPTVIPQATAPPRHNYTVFEWYLKPEYINNVTWLGSIINYNTSKTWSENYFSLISGRGGSAFPAQAHDSLAAAYLTVLAFVGFDFVVLG